MNTSQADYLKAAALCWLRYKQRCFIVTTERGLKQIDRPDALGVTIQRRWIEVEVKVSMRDFLANRTKHVMSFRALGLYVPWKFYFCVPPEMVEAAKPNLREGEGLLTVEEELDSTFGNPIIKVVTGATPDSRNSKLSIHELVHLVRKQSNTLCKYAVKASQPL